MKVRDIVLGLGILAIIAGVVIWQRNIPSLVSEPVSPQTEEKFEESFRYNIPDDFEKVELTNTTNEGFIGVATRKYSDNNFIHTLLADLPDPSPGSFYEGWLIKGDDRVSTGRLQIAKGGYLLEFESIIDYTDYSKVEVTLEKVADPTPEKLIFQGTF